MDTLQAPRVYLATRFFQSLFFTTIVTVNLVYQATIVGLNPFQLVLVGTLLETITFFFEIPTGVVADVYSRKLSTVFGVILVGLGFMIEAAFPSFFFVLLAQVVWGIGFTFISGAREAWISGEIGEEKANKIFLKGTQVSQAGSILGIVLSVVLASVNIRLPILFGGFFHALWGIALYFVMPENHFVPTKQGKRSNWEHLIHTFKSGLAVVKNNRALLIMIAVGGIFGMFSEGFDRLWTPYILQFTFPSIGNLPIITWFGIISIVAMLLTTIVVEFTNRTVDTSKHHSVVAGYMILIALLIVAVMGFSLAGGFIVAISFYWIASALRESIGPLYTTSLNQNSKPEVRATVFSIASQANSVGQIFGGPILGFIATIISIRYGLLVGAISLVPILALFLFIKNKNASL